MKNLSSGSRAVPCRQTDRWMDMTKLTVAFHNFEMHLKTIMKYVSYRQWHCAS